MATAYWTCRECGEQTKVSHGNRRDTDRYAEWMASSRLCHECESRATAKLHVEQSALAAARAEADCLPALVGSPKQIAWAETLRIARLDGIRDIVDEIGEASAANVTLGRITADQRDAGMLAATAFLADLVCETSAKRFIDERPGGYSRHANDRHEIALRVRAAVAAIGATSDVAEAVACAETIRAEDVR